MAERHRINLTVVASVALVLLLALIWIVGRVDGPSDYATIGVSATPAP